jgi:hypothetical protein
VNALWQRFSRPEWALNPVVIKELRQAMRSWFITGSLLLFLSALLIFMVIYLVNSTIRSAAVNAIGREAFWFLLAILTGACAFFIPVYTGTRLALERREDNLDLLYVTSLSPHRIILGKMLCGVYLVLLLFSASLPFILLTNLLRGIDLRTIVLSLGFLFAYVCLILELAILIGCLRVSALFKALLGLLALWPLAGMTAAFTMSFAARGSGMSPVAVFGTPSFRVGTVVVVLFLAALVWLHLCSVALISPRSMNRAFPLRLYSTWVWLGSGVYCVYESFRLSSADAMIGWLLFGLVLGTVALVVGVSSDDPLSFRIRRQIPRSRDLRALAFPFFSGAGSGVLWALGLVAATLGIGLWMFNRHQEWVASGKTAVTALDLGFMLKFVGTGVYICAYLLTGLFIQRRFFSRRKPVLAGIIGFAIPTAFALGPMLLLFLADRLSWRVLEELQLGNVFNLLAVDPGDWTHPHFLFSGAWWATALALNAAWFVRQWRAFQPLESQRQPPPA